METSAAISIIIPTYNESEYIGSLIRYLKFHSPRNIQIIVSDGGSTDNTISIASKEGAKVVRSDKKGRASQMNYGASFASFDILYFVHADCFPPKNFYTKIINAINKDYTLGRFQTKFDSDSLLLKINAFFTRFDWFVCTGGDQTLFFKTQIFKKINGYNDDLILMEDFDIVKRARKDYRYAVLKDKVLVSARKYSSNSWLTVQRAHHTIIKMYRSGERQETLVKKYKQLLKYRY